MHMCVCVNRRARWTILASGWMATTCRSRTGARSRLERTGWSSSELYSGSFSALISAFEGILVMWIHGGAPRGSSAPGRENYRAVSAADHKSCREKTTAEGIKRMRLFLRRVVTELLGQLPTQLQQMKNKSTHRATCHPTTRQLCRCCCCCGGGGGCCCCCFPNSGDSSSPPPPPPPSPPPPEPA
jgi:hypothetical protein